MPTITPNRELHQLFLDWGFDPLPSAHAYTGMVAISDSPREQEVRVVFAEDNAHFHLQSIVEAEGEADQLTIDAAADCVREGVKVEVSSRVALHSERFSVTQAEYDFTRVLQEVLWIANHADSAAQEARDNRARFQELTGLVGRQFDAAENLSKPELLSVIHRLREMLDLNPNPELWAVLLGGASKNALHFWSIGSEKISQEPWDRVAQFLTSYGKRRGWNVN